ncbi:MAG: hypothetical protein U0798_17580 [Gemmataceae bacterium]
MAKDRERLVLELEDAGDPLKQTHGFERDVNQRLKLFLKRMLRQEGLRCLRLCDGDRVEIRIRESKGVATTNPLQNSEKST